MPSESKEPRGLQDRNEWKCHSGTSLQCNEGGSRSPPRYHPDTGEPVCLSCAIALGMEDGRFAPTLRDTTEDSSVDG